MNFEAMKAILDKIKAYDKIVIFRHFRPDGDAVGSTRGLGGILRLSYPEKDVRFCNDDFSDYISFLGDETEQPSDEFLGEALGIVIDTATPARISSKKYLLCRELVKIDHHIPIENYGDLHWVEEERSSASEMIAAFYDTFRDELKMDVETATCIYTGMVTDSGRFRFRSVSGDTMRLAGMLLDKGIDLDRLYAQLYMRDFESFKFQSFVYANMRITENGVAYVHITNAVRERFGLSYEEASNCVSYMDAIKGSLIWIGFIDAAGGEIRVRLRSRFVTINDLAEEYSGGGHACAAGATVHSTKELQELVDKADKRLKEYKENNEGWL
ncbi:MAG: bifunctional oligoribonuclease/PAP phosphatase NrnA [Clostridia bacterium]|nr:bifunctional oligoribonuclease/PAP phosphatase NrnA [Clostridia bacterium]